MLKLIALIALGAFFILAGINHFWHPGVYMRIMPVWLPAHKLLVQISGAAEIGGGIAVFVPALRWYAGLWLILLLIAVFPANVQMALQPELYSRIASPAMLYARLPLQLVLIAWVWFTCLGAVAVPIRPATVTLALSAHHGRCSAQSRLVLGSRTALFLSRPLPYRPYNCMSYTMARLLQTGCGRLARYRSTTFMFFASPLDVTLTENGYRLNVRIASLGAALEPGGRSTSLYFPLAAFPKPPLPPGIHRTIEKGAPSYAGVYAAGDVLGLKSGECPV